ncbi:MAG: exodeoxyribonuclease VII small subunit [Dehalococcoidia bacterium]
MTEDAKTPSFEDVFTQLRETVQALEAGNLSLDEATKLFDKGMRLAKTCNELLSAAELRITRLQRSFGEQMAMIATPDDEGFPEPGDDDGDED